MLRANDAMRLSLHLYITNSSQLMHSLKEKRRYYMKGKKYTCRITNEETISEKGQYYYKKLGIR